MIREPTWTSRRTVRTAKMSPLIVNATIQRVAGATQSHRFYCGIDLDARSIYGCVLDAGGGVAAHHNLKAEPGAFLRFIDPRSSARSPQTDIRTRTAAAGNPQGRASTPRLSPTRPHLPCSARLMRLSSLCVTLVASNQVAYSWDKFNRYIHGGMGRGLIRCLVLRHGFLIGLGLIVLKDPSDALRVPARGKVLLLHGLLLVLLRRAFLAFGPSSYAVITKTEPSIDTVRQAY